MNKLEWIVFCLSCSFLSFGAGAQGALPRPADQTESFEHLLEVNAQVGATEVPFAELESFCGEDVAERMTNQVILVAERLGEACEKQNQKFPEKARCPFQSCMTEYRNGGYPAPVLEVKVGNTPTMGGIGSIGSIGGYGSGSSSSTQDKLYIAVLVKFNLFPDPDKIVCASPLSPTVTNQLITQVMNEVAKTPNCSPK